MEFFWPKFVFNDGIGILNLCLTLPTFAFTFDELSEVESNPWLKGSGCSSSIIIKRSLVCSCQMLGFFHFHLSQYCVIEHALHGGHGGNGGVTFLDKPMPSCAA